MLTTLFRLMALLVALLTSIGCRTQSVVGTWHVHGRDDQEMIFHQDGTFVWNTVWPHGPYGTSGPSVVPAGGVYTIGKSHHIVIQQTKLGVGNLAYPYAPEEYRYSVSREKLLLRSITNGTVIQYHRVGDKK